MPLTKRVHEPVWISEVKVIHWPWSKVTQIQHFQTYFSEKPLGRLKPNLMWRLNGMGEQKFVQIVQVTWPRWLPCPYMVKKWKIVFLLWNQKADDLESLYAALDTRVLPNLFRWWPWVDFDLFYGKVKFGSPCFCMGKDTTMDFSETIVVCDIKVSR